MSSFSREPILELLPRIRERIDAAEAGRRIPSETIDDLRAAGLFRALVPEAFGGTQADLGDVLDVFMELGRACTSTAWVASLLTLHNHGVALFDPRAQREIWENGPDALVVSSIAPSGKLREVDGGYRLDGQWGFVSGVDHGKWAMLGARLEQPNHGKPAGPVDRTWRAPPPPNAFLALVPAADYTIIDDWHVAGLQATGSKSVAVKDAYVPAHRALSTLGSFLGNAPGLSATSPAVYRAPFRATFAAAFPPVALGTAHAALDAFRDLTATRTHAYFGAAFKHSPSHLMRLAEAATVLRSARLLFRHDIDKLHHSADLTGDARTAFEIQATHDSAFVIDRCSHVINRLYRGSGGRALYTRGAMQRHFRDIHAMTQHAMADLEPLGITYAAVLMDQAQGAAPGEWTQALAGISPKTWPPPR